MIPMPCDDCGKIGGKRNSLGQQIAASQAVPKLLAQGAQCLTAEIRPALYENIFEVGQTESAANTDSDIAPDYVRIEAITLRGNGYGTAKECRIRPHLFQSREVAMDKLPFPVDARINPC